MENERIKSLERELKFCKSELDKNSDSMERNDKLIKIASILILITTAQNIFALQKNKKEIDLYREAGVHTIEKQFDIGEHTVIVPTDSIPDEFYLQHDGYEIVEICEDYILYKNDEEVTCVGISDNYNNIQFFEFGKPIQKSISLS